MGPQAKPDQVKLGQAWPQGFPSARHPHSLVMVMAVHTVRDHHLVNQGALHQVETQPGEARRRPANLVNSHPTGAFTRLRGNLVKLHSTPRRARVHFTRLRGNLVKQDGAQPTW